MIEEHLYFKETINKFDKAMVEKRDLHNILIVDDSPTQRLILQRYMLKLKYNPILVDNGQRVVDMFEKNKPIGGLNRKDIAVIILDLLMPNVSGFDVMQKIKPIKGDIPIIVLTANNSKDVQLKAIDAGATDYIMKDDRHAFIRIEAALKHAINFRAHYNHINVNTSYS